MGRSECGGLLTVHVCTLTVHVDICSVNDVLSSSTRSPSMLPLLRERSSPSSRDWLGSIISFSSSLCCCCCCSSSSYYYCCYYSIIYYYKHTSELAFFIPLERNRMTFKIRGQQYWVPFGRDWRSWTRSLRCYKLDEIIFFFSLSSGTGMEFLSFHAGHLSLIRTPSSVMWTGVNSQVEGHSLIGFRFVETHSWKQRGTGYVAWSLKKYGADE